MTLTERFPHKLKIGSENNTNQARLHDAASFAGRVLILVLVTEKQTIHETTLTNTKILLVTFRVISWIVFDFGPTSTQKAGKKLRLDTTALLGALLVR